jgi:hypothetical protein
MRQIAEFPECAPTVHAELRRALLQRFPYCVFYAIEGAGLVVIGCFDARRDPEVWRVRTRR